jgi:pimeloyl-ACP methyl ester carboxylesterase
VRALSSRPPVAGGIDLDVPGVDVRLRATRWAGAGVPVLLLHGLASTRRFWDLVVPELAGMPVVALDQRGHGDSDRPDGPYDGATVVRDALTALDALGLSRVVVVGHSWGAATALRLAAEAPGRVLAAVAIDGGTGVPRDAAVSRAELRERLTPPRPSVAAADLPALVRGGPLGPWWSDEVEAALLPLFGVADDGTARARLPFEAHMAIVDDLLDTDSDAVLSRVACPAWVVACSPTADRSAALDRAAGLLARPRVQRWDGAVHDVPLQWPALVAGLVKAAASEAAVLPAREGARA